MTTTRTILPALVMIWCCNASAWTIDDDIDNMTGKAEKSATVKSKNSAILKYPYGEIRSRLVIRNHPRYGKDVIFAADKGQIPCRSYDPCTILVRFDDNPPLRFSGSNPSDGSSEVVFIRGYDRFTKALAKATHVQIEAVFWNNGGQSFAFNVKGFSTEMLATTAKREEKKKSP